MSIINDLKKSDLDDLVKIVNLCKKLGTFRDVSDCESQLALGDLFWCRIEDLSKEYGIVERRLFGKCDLNKYKLIKSIETLRDDLKI